MENQLNFFFGFHKEFNDSEESLKFYSLLAVAISDVKQDTSNKSTKNFILFIKQRFKQLNLIHKNSSSIDLKPRVPKKYYKF